MLVYIRNAVFLATGLRFSLILFRLWIANAQVLRIYQRSIRRHSRRSIVGIFGDSLLTIEQYIQLFKAFPMLETREDEYEQQRLTKIYHCVKKICSSHTLKTDPLTARSAIKLQAKIAQYVFQQLFALMLTEGESEILGQYGSVNTAIKDFLEYCGYGNGSPFVSPLPIQLPLFLEWSEIRRGRSTMRGNFLRILVETSNLSKKVGALGRIKALWFWAKCYSCRIFWNHEDIRDRNMRLTSRKRIHGEMDEKKLSLKVRFDATSQNNVLTILTYKMYFQAISVLIDIENDIKMQGQNQDKIDQFDLAIHGLEHNIKTTLPECFE